VDAVEAVRLDTDQIARNAPDGEDEDLMIA
jgi:hypothetical protein